MDGDPGCWVVAGGDLHGGAPWPEGEELAGVRHLCDSGHDLKNRLHGKQEESNANSPRAPFEDGKG